MEEPNLRIVKKEVLIPTENWHFKLETTYEVEIKLLAETYHSIQYGGKAAIFVNKCDAQSFCSHYVAFNGLSRITVIE